MSTATAIAAVRPTAGVNIQVDIPASLKALVAAQDAINAEGLDPMLRHLVLLRASQLNQCVFCVKMHTREAREDGETNERLDRLVIWRHVNDYTDSEKAALALTEALTVIDPNADLAPIRARLREHFNEKQVAALVATVAMINLWNRIQGVNH